MKRHCTLLLAFLALLIHEAPVRAQATQPASSKTPRIARVEAGLLRARTIKARPAVPMRLDERMRHYKVPGVSIAVIDSFRIAWARGYGVREAGDTSRVATETLFQAASISKPVAALAALRLVQEGKLSLDENVNLKLTSWKVPENDFTIVQPVTLRRLLSHGAGLTVHGFPGYASNTSVPTVRQVLDGQSPANTAAIRVDTLPVDVGPRTLSSLAGRYALETQPNFVITVTVDSGRVVVDVPRQIRTEIYPESETQYFSLDQELDFVFSSGDGKVTGFVLSAGPATYKAKRVD
jgi:CubicO group peptidase (beta-lactamase class C family)